MYACMRMLAVHFGPRSIYPAQPKRLYKKAGESHEEMISIYMWRRVVLHRDLERYRLLRIIKASACTRIYTD